MISTGIFGAGRLAQAVKAVIETGSKFRLAWMADRGEAPGTDAEIVLDASLAGAVPEHIDWAVKHRTPIVIAATGWDTSILEHYRDALKETAIMTAPNMSLSVAFARRVALAMGRLSVLLEGSDMGVVEQHHIGKLDSPSGTAINLAMAMGEGASKNGGWNMGKKEPGTINIASLRMGSSAGRHELHLEGPNEKLMLVHEAYNREIFARGALLALGWLKGKTGLYSFDEMSRELTDGFFR